MQNNISYLFNLLDLLKKQEETIIKQNEMIAKLVNENLEKENMVNILTNEFRLEQQ